MTGNTEDLSTAQQEITEHKADGGWNEATPFLIIKGADCCGRVGAYRPGGDGMLLLNLTRAYDLLRGAEALTPDREQRIVEDLILAGCADTECWNEINNKCPPVRALSALVGYGVMNLAMTATPLAMQRAGFTFDHVATTMIINQQSRGTGASISWNIKTCWDQSSWPRDP